MIPILKIPKDCLPSFREVWEDYNVRAVVKGSPRVLDIGANVGAFSLMARELWPTCEVTAYEPNPELFQYLQHNVGDFATCINAAITDCKTPLRLVNDGPNRMCGHLAHCATSEVNLDVVHPDTLPEADIVKIDVEGGELEIVKSLRTPLLLMVEYHNEYDRVMIGLLLRGKMTLMHSHVGRPGLGIMHFAKV